MDGSIGFHAVPACLLFALKSETSYSVYYPWSLKPSLTRCRSCFPFLVFYFLNSHQTSLELLDLLFPPASHSGSLCPRLGGVVYDPFILLCNYECCSLYPHLYDEPDRYAGRWMARGKKQNEKRAAPFSSQHICPSALTWGDAAINLTYSHECTDTDKCWLRLPRSNDDCGCL